MSLTGMVGQDFICDDCGMSGRYGENVVLLQKAVRRGHRELSIHRVLTSL